MGLDDSEEILSYERIRDFSREEVDALLAIDDPQALLYVPIGVALNCDDLDWAAQLCARLAVHQDPTVRGNALLSFGHLARRFKTLDLETAIPLLKKGLQDGDLYVREQARDGFDEVRHALKLE